MIEDLVEANKRLDYYESKYGPYIQKRGLGNWRNLFKKPSPNDWIVLVLLIMAIFMAFAYQNDVSTCRAWIANQSIVVLPGAQDIPSMPEGINFTKAVIKNGPG